uniref:Uncharacterized protein n=1 Tax=Ciona intestinalis TaxID=7719 RepID=H2XQC7_CIOIN
MQRLVRINLHATRASPVAVKNTGHFNSTAEIKKVGRRRWDTFSFHFLFPFGSKKTFREL